MKQINLTPKINWQIVAILFMFFTFFLSVALILANVKLEKFLELQNTVTELTNQKIKYIGQKEYSDRVANKLLIERDSLVKLSDIDKIKIDSLLGIDKSADIYFTNEKIKTNEKRKQIFSSNNIYDSLANYVRTNENRYARYR